MRALITLGKSIKKELSVKDSDIKLITSTFNYFISTKSSIYNH